MVPAGSALNASSVGANTVSGPSPFSAPARPAAFAAAISVLNVPASAAVSTMSLSLPCPASAGADRLIAASASQIFFSVFIFGVLQWGFVRPQFAGLYLYSPLKADWMHSKQYF